jgi:hypothetical protein
VKKIKKNRPGGDVVSITHRQVKKKTNITHITMAQYYFHPDEKVVKRYNY